MFHVKHRAEVVVVGGGHAGCEASLASARMGVTTFLVTMDTLKIAEMSCNPSIGGVGKGQLTKEIDALGGEMGKNADYTGIQFKRLNTRKGSAVQSSRCQSDKVRYARRMQGVIAQQPNLTVVAGEVKAVLVENGRVKGLTVVTKAGETQEIATENLVITAGTFMRGLMHTGNEKTAGGRAGEQSSEGLSDRLKDLGFTLMRLKTGTPPRLLRDSIDFSQMERQEGDQPPRRFSFSPTEIPLPQVPCYLTYTNADTHRAIQENLARSPLYSGIIRGIGPRYCPSIEDKVVKFPEKPRHQLFFEPESLESDWIYPNGISTSLPADVQERFVRSLPGCQNVIFARYGYAVEYDCIAPTQLHPTLESKAVKGLYFGGQVNGTSGYEEAAAQGLIAGINAALSARAEPPFVLSRTESYIGVMIDDLILMGVTEPYRMFTSRAEFRLSLREDNADLRLRPYGRKLGLVCDSDYQRYEEKKALIARIKTELKREVVKPSSVIDEKFANWGTPPLAAPQPALQILRRPELTLSNVLTLGSFDELRSQVDSEVEETAEIEIKYEGYINLQREEIARLKKMSDLAIPDDLDFSSVIGLSFEVRDKFQKNRPRTLSEASRISGVTPAALTALLFHLRQKGEPSAVTG